MPASGKGIERLVKGNSTVMKGSSTVMKGSKGVRRGECGGEELGVKVSKELSVEMLSFRIKLHE